MNGNTAIKVGFGRAKITPTLENGLLPIPLNNSVTAESVYNDIYASAIAINDGTKTVVFVSIELRSMLQKFYDYIAELIQKETGLAREQVVLAVIHNHSAPEVAYMSTDTIEAYKRFCASQILEAVKLSLSDLAPTSKLLMGKTRTERMNFVRRHLLEDHTWASVTTKRAGRAPIGYESFADPELRTVRFCRDGKKDIIITNWQCHPAAMYPKNTINADWIHFIREGIEADHDAYFAYLQGACGNINQYGFKGDVRFEGPDASEQLGRALIDVINTSMQDMQEAEITEIRQKCEVLPLIRHPKFETNEPVDVHLRAFSIGDLAFATAPFEFFHQQGEYIRANSPYKMTFICCYSNGYCGYTPTPETYAHGEYEPRVCWFHANTGNDCAKILADNLNDLCK